jgi:hypothetical protein
MPSVTGERLDVAYSDLAFVGVPKEDIEVVGGGTFGVLKAENWQVCQQRPAPGAPIASVRFVVDRACSGESTSGSEVPAPSAGGGAAPAGAMPDLVGMVLQDAQDALQAKGSYLLDQQDASGQGRLQLIDSNWRVCSQSPAPGASLSATTIVTLAAVKLAESCP